jgi:hypothetical protein
MAGRFLRAVLSVIITVLILAAVVLCVRQFVVFSGQLSSQQWAKAFDMIASRLVIPFGGSSIRTPYHGFFDVNNALTIVAVLAAEWGLSVVRDRA